MDQLIVNDGQNLNCSPAEALEDAYLYLRIVKLDKLKEILDET